MTVRLEEGLHSEYKALLKDRVQTSTFYLTKRMEDAQLMVRYRIPLRPLDKLPCEKANGVYKAESIRAESQLFERFKNALGLLGVYDKQEFFRRAIRRDVAGLYPHNALLHRFDPIVKACGQTIGNICFRDVFTMNELIGKFEEGSWCAGTGFVWENLAFVEQVSGANEWLTLRKCGADWEEIDSLSMYRILENSGREAASELLRSLQGSRMNPVQSGSPPKSEEPTPDVSEPVLSI